MATLSAGYSFGASETVTNAKLASLVNSGSISSITQTDIAAGEGLVYVGTSAPADTDRVWVDTNSTPVILRFYNSNLSAWVTPDNLAVYTNKSSQTGAAGRVLILDTSNSNSYTYTSTAGDSKFLGIETGSIAANASAPVVAHGSTVVLLEVSASAGTYLRTSTATGKAEPCVNTSSGVFGYLTESGTASARTRIFGLVPVSATATTGPAFSVHNNGTNQTGIASGFSKITWSTEEYDTNSCFASSKFTPNASGYYMLTFKAAFNNMAAGARVQTSIYENGSLLKTLSDFTLNGAVVPSLGGTVQVSATGSGDYFETYIYHTHTASATFDGTATNSYFMGAFLRS